MRSDRKTQKAGCDNSNGERERRMKRRFQIEQEVRYKMLYGQRIAETGTGKTSNIIEQRRVVHNRQHADHGDADRALDELAGAAERFCPMKLMIYGCVVRSNERGAAVAIERYEFRTQGKVFAQAMQQPVELSFAR